MLSPFDLPLFVLYSLAGTTAAAFGKAAMHRVRARQWSAAALGAAATIATFAVNFALLFVLLARIDMSVMVPVGVGLNLLVAAVLSILVFRERIGGAKLAGMLLIACGVALLSVGL
ncbi:MAG: EamA family transporter [Proteobacteria bacterium]|nr:EamA family transporter [Pseudomonadota bacterium]